VPNRKQDGFHGDIDKRSEILGVNWSDRNHIKTKWELHCGSNNKIDASQGIDRIGTREISASEQTCERGKAKEQSLSEVLDCIQLKGGQDLELDKKEEHRKKLEDMISRLNRIEADIDLALRISSHEQDGGR